MQDLSGYLGLPDPEGSSESASGHYQRKLYSLVTDTEMPSSLYDNSMRIYD